MITDHFRKRTEQRTPYNDVESLMYDLELQKESMIHLHKYSNQLNVYPKLRKKFRKYPFASILVYEFLNLCVVVENGNKFVTVYSLFDY